MAQQVHVHPRSEHLTNGFAARVLPDDGGCNGFAGVVVPDNKSLALVIEPRRGNIVFLKQGRGRLS